MRPPGEIWLRVACFPPVMYKEGMEIKVIARIRTDFPTKFGIPRQSGLAETKAEIIFEPGYASEDAVRGLEGYSYIWLIWEFSKSVGRHWHPTVRPPRLGGNTRVGVFATRSPFRPNPIGLSSVKLDRIEMRRGVGPVLHVTGADLMDGTPIYDIKPYLPYADSHPEAKAGFTDVVPRKILRVVYLPETGGFAPEYDRGKAGFTEKQAAGTTGFTAEQVAATTGLTPEQVTELTQILAQDPRPSYQTDPGRIYGMEFAGYEVRFKVEDEILTVVEIRLRSE